MAGVLVKKKLTMRAVAEILGLLVSALGLIYISRIVGPEYVGFSATTSAVIILLSRLADGGLTSYASQLLARDDEPLKQIMTIITPPKLILSVLIIGITLIVVAIVPIDQKLKFFMNVSITMVLLESCAPTWIFAALGRINIASVIRIMQSLLYAVAIVVFIRKPEDWRYLPYLTVFNSAANFSLALIFLCYFHPRSYDLHLFRDNYSSRLNSYYRGAYHFLKADLSGYVYTTSDRLILYYFTNSYTVGLYEAAYKVINPFYAINGVVTPTFFRDLAQSFKQGNIARVMSRYLFIMSTLSIPLGFYLIYFSPFVVKVLYGSRFAQSASPLMILGFVITFGFTSGIIALPFSAWNMQREFGNSVFWGNVLNTVLNFGLIPFWGAVGAAIATLAAKIIVTVVAYYYFRKVTDYPVVSDFGWFFFASLVPLIVVVIAAQFTANNYLLTVLYGLVYFTLIFVIYRRVFQKRMTQAEVPT